MKTLLVLAQHPSFAEAVRAAVNPEGYRMIHRFSLEEAEPLLHGALFGACIIDADAGNARWIWMIEKLRQRVPQCPIIVYTGAEGWEWEEEAYLLGVSHVVAKPVRARMLNSLLERAISPSPAAAPRSARPAAPLPASALLKPWPPRLTARPRASQPLEFSRHFSTILTHSLDAEGLLKKFLLLLRDLVGVNRASIFLHEPAPAFGKSLPPEKRRRLHKGCAIGLASDMVDNLELSLDSGIGGQLRISGKILRRDSEEAHADPQIQQEFDILGAQVAVPILDRETIIGVAVFDGRVTGEPLLNSELERSSICWKNWPSPSRTSGCTTSLRRITRCWPTSSAS